MGARTPQRRPGSRSALCRRFERKRLQAAVTLIPVQRGTPARSGAPARGL